MATIKYLSLLQQRVVCKNNDEMLVGNLLQ